MGRIMLLFLSLCLTAVLGSPSPEASAYASDYTNYIPATQFHAQDDHGQYNYGFSSPDQTKSEVKTADGVVRGAYSYVDANGIIQSVNYISDALGFRVAASNLPVHHVEPVEEPVVQSVAAPVAAAPVQPVQAALAPSVDYSYLPYAQGYTYQVQHQPVAAAPIPVAAPVAVAAPVLGSQYHSQDDFGQYSFGYNDPTSVRQEIKTADGVVRGGYRYIDSDGKVQTVEYIADGAGFRVAGTNLPRGTVDLPVSVVDTPEVAAAKHAHLEAVALANSLEDLPQEVDRSAEPEAQYYGAAAVEVPVAQPGVFYGAAAKTPQVTYAAAPVHVAAPVAVAVPVVHAAPVAPQGSQYHAQDDAGQYSFGYSDGNSVKQEIKTADGVVRGAYSYVDSDGIVQSVNYIADALGFRVGATNLPVHHVDPVADHEPVAVAAPVAAPVQVAAAPVAAPVVAAYSAPVVTPQVNYAYLPYATNYGYSLPASTPVVEAAPAAHPVAVAAHPVAVAATPLDIGNSQYHAQDDHGQYNYGYSSPDQTKQELKTADGVTRGAYSYVDANGIVQTVNYISDAMGFRVAATNLPVHHIESNHVEGEAVVHSPHVPYAQSYGYAAASA